MHFLFNIVLKFIIEIKKNKLEMLKRKDIEKKIEKKKNSDFSTVQKQF